MESQILPLHPNCSAKRTHVPFLGFIPDGPRKHFLAILSEFVGTVLFLLFSYAGLQIAQLDGSDPQLSGTVLGGTNVAGSPSNTSQLLFISLSFGFSLAVTAWIFFRVSGSLFNPVITLAMCLIGAIPPIRGALIATTQIVAGIAAAALCSCLYPGPLTTETVLGGGTSVSRGLFIEMFMTSLLVLTVLMLAAEKHKSTYLAPIGIGLSLFVGMMGSVYYTGGSLNPARSFGPAVVNRSFPVYHWIYWVGPILGSVLATGFYQLIKVFEYKTVNPDQDKTTTEIRQERRSDMEAMMV